MAGGRRLRPGGSQRRAGELADFIVAAAEHYEFALEKLAAVGYPNGANIAAAVLWIGGGKQDAIIFAGGDATSGRSLAPGPARR